MLSDSHAASGDGVPTAPNPLDAMRFDTCAGAKTLEADQGKYPKHSTGAYAL